MKTAFLRDASFQYEASSLILLEKRKWSVAYHIAGLSVEFALKACLAKKFARNAIPDRKLVQQVYTHELARLVQLADLEPPLARMARRSPRFAGFWVTVRNWEIDSRYANWSMIEAKDIVEAISEPVDGVLVWIRSHW